MADRSGNNEMLVPSGWWFGIWKVISNKKQKEECSGEESF